MEEQNLNQAMEGLNKIDAKIVAMEKDVAAGKADREAVEKKIDEIGEQQKKLALQIFEIQQAGVKNEKTAVLSPGAHFVGSDSYKAFQKTAFGTRSASFVVSNKAATTPITSDQAYLQPYRVPGIIPLEQQALVIESLFPKIPTTAQTIEAVLEKEFTNGAATVAEGAQKPSSALSFETKQAHVQVIAHWTKITKQLADDANALHAFIDTRMIYGVNKVAEDQILSGDGTGSNLTGIMTSGNFTEQAFTLAQLGGSNSTLLDLLRICFATVEAAGYVNSAVVLNPMDFAVLQGLKDSNGAYLLGSPANSFANTTIWGTRVVKSAAMPQGKFLAGDFARAASIYDRQQTVIDIAAQNEDDFIKNLFTIRAERRMALLVERPAAVIGGSLAVPAA